MLRLARAEDSAALVGLMIQFSQEVAAPLTKEHVLGALEPLLANPGIGDVWILESDVPLGYLVITWGWGIESGGKEALIDELFVIPEARNQGLATAMLQAAIERAQENGTKAVFLETELENPKSRDLYKRLGFQEESSVWLRALVEAND